MPPTIRDGMVASEGTNAINSDRHVVDILGEIYMIDPKSNPTGRAPEARARVGARANLDDRHRHRHTARASRPRYAMRAPVTPT